MSGSRPSPAEQHLGDRLAALIDGELGHDARERVLAHLATCPKCKAEADAQRSLKNAFAQAAPPPPTESFLARLQGLPGGGDGPSGGAFGAGVFPSTPDPFRYDPSDGHGVLPPAERGFRVHHIGRTEAERAASRSRRFAFAAAGAVSLAAIALGGVSAGTTGGGGNGEVRGAGSNVTPQGAQGTGGGATADATRRRTNATVSPEVSRESRAEEGVQALAAPVRTPLSAEAPAPYAAALHPPTGEASRHLAERPLAPLLSAASMSPFLRAPEAVRSAVLTPLVAPPVESATTMAEAGPSPSASASPLR
ncbi:zf-HC2 domain-containing protein [Streptomyces sp. NA04227]|uniref:zf-HC2 domain-containing protein n=1 Tax=Streptomyces sp. NA04227 TaxID=2742136 RepID=UPI0015911A42|nr:zf-HC2 domain-containing protein [Streptomyces sp. NA04227]QKW08977.1 zf-HC2 domain-containing protein [Streptomyces sp. NA04227]